MERPPESLKSFANRVATLAASEDSAQLVRLLKLSGLIGGAAALINLDHENGGLPDGAKPAHVGIWQRKVENGKPCFVRRNEMRHEWHYWANVGRIEAKGSKRRVVLIGESVARGYLYDPEFTPAMALEMILAPHFEAGVEVIDLARTNLSFKVRELAISALELQPDIVIVFAGNNWCINEPQPSEITETDEALTKDGIAGAKRTADAQIARTARRIVKDIAGAYKSSGVPLVWIVPEYNLADWRDPVTTAPYLGEGLNREWLSLLEDAEAALREHDFGRAKELAEKMIELDQGVCAAGLYVLADCSHHANDLASERKYLELARDAVSWDSSTMARPRPYSVTQEVLRDEAGQQGNDIVDLPALFKEHLNGGIPGRRLFLDYCHLTVEGIQIAMGAAASCVLSSLNQIDVPWFALVGTNIAPSRETEAEAAFLAAIMNGHWSPSDDAVRYYCTRALTLSPHVADLMLNYITMQSQRLLPPRMSESEEELSKLGSPLVHQYLLRLNDKRLDKRLLNTMAQTLEDFGIDARERLDQVRREEHSFARGEVNLLDYYYCSASEQLQELAWLNQGEEKRYRQEAEYYRAYRPKSRFTFIGEAGYPLRLSLTCRLPDSTSHAKISIELNGRPQLEITASSDWTSWDINLSGAVDGLNEIAVSWPLPGFDSGAALKQARAKLFERKFPNFYPVFGEIHSFTAAAVNPVSANIPAVQEELTALEMS